MEYTNYMKVLSEYHSEGFTFFLRINWNVEAISGASNANGYVVQHFIRKSMPSNFKVDDADYFEAWKIQNGVCIDRGDICDDIFSVDNSLAESIKSCMRTTGHYSINADVYWVPYESELYKSIDAWSNNTVLQAGGLKSSYYSPEEINKYFVFSRPLFTHEWSLLTKEEIETKVLRAALRYCPNHTNRDIELLEDLLNNIFENEELSLIEVKQRILRDWHNSFNL